jgi:phage/plasmid-like protein (TIGR03299 family)
MVQYTHQERFFPITKETTMPAAVETMMFAGATPWHGLGTQVSEDITIADAIVESGLDWRVGLKPLQTTDGIPVNHRATYRESDGAIFGVVGPRYTPLQNSDAFSWFQPFLDAGECKLHTAGSLHGGQKVWVLAQLNRDCSEIVPGDEVCKFILLSNSHDGTTSIRVGYTPIRVVCINTMAYAHSHKNSKLIRIRHTNGSKQKMDDLRDIMDNINAGFEATAEQFRFLASRTYNQKDIEKFVKVMLDIKPEDEVKTRTQNIIDDIMGRIEGPKQSASNVRGTWWAAMNGYNEYLNYAKGRSTSNRLDSLWFGQGAIENLKVLETATQFANAI